MKVLTKWQGQRAFTAVGDSGYEVKMDATPAYGGEGKWSYTNRNVIGFFSWMYRN